MAALKVIDLFAGAGGFSLGFKMFSEKQGKPAFQSVWANDFNKDAAETFNANFGNHCVHGDILELLESGIKIPTADVVIGGPPCQGFSLLNKNRKELDPRKHMWIPFMDIVELTKSKVFVMENVPELLTSEEFVLIEQRANELGFIIKHQKIVAADYGVPQVRTRAFIMGSRIGDPADVFPPLRTHYDPRKDKIKTGDYVLNPKPWKTVKEAIGDLAKPKGTEIRGECGTDALHFGRNPTELSLQRYKAIPKPGMNRFDLQRLAPELTPNCWINKKSGGTDLFGRLWWDRPSVTIRTEFFKPEKGRYLHPTQHRPITHREAARFQSFPDSFIFKGSKTEVARQIGNAVAPLVAEKIAEVVFSHFEKNQHAKKIKQISERKSTTEILK